MKQYPPAPIEKWTMPTLPRILWDGIKRGTGRPHVLLNTTPGSHGADMNSEG